MRSGCRRTWSNCQPLAEDVSTVADCGALAQRYAAREPVLDILVNNAGAAWGAPLVDFPESGWSKVMNLNVKSPFFLLQQLLPSRRASSGPRHPAKVTNIASVDRLRVSP